MQSLCPPALSFSCGSDCRAVFMEAPHKRRRPATDEAVQHDHHEGRIRVRERKGHDAGSEENEPIIIAVAVILSGVAH